MDRKHLPKVEPWTYPETGGWFLDTEIDKEGNTLGEVVMILVPTVHGYGNIANHSVDRNGEVNASVLLRGAKDGVDAEYHEWVVLDGWDPGTFKLESNRYIERG